MKHQPPICYFVTEWHGILFLHVGPWKGGVFRFSLLIPDG